MKLKYLVTGTGRCGTVYLARLLTSLGILCGHESVFDHHGLEGANRKINGLEPIDLSYASQNEFKLGKWKSIPKWLSDIQRIEADSSYMAAPFLNECLLADVIVIHVVRNPIKVIQSFCNYIDYFTSSLPVNMYELFIYSHLPEMQNNLSRYDRAALFYIKWNEMIEKRKADLFFRIEDDPLKVVEFVGKSGDYFKESNINSFQKSCREKFTLDKIENNNIKRDLISIADRYGYRIESEYLLL